MAEQENNQESAAQAPTSAPQSFDIRKVYLKDASLECPNSPAVFLGGNEKPEITIDASIKAEALKQEDYYDVSLGITVTAKLPENTSFLVEVHQAGVFHIVNVPDEDMPLALEIACPNILLPFARETIADLVAKAGFPQLLLSPINFEGLFQQKLDRQAAAAESTQPADDSAAH